MTNSLSLIFLPLLSLVFYICVIFDLVHFLRGPAPWPPEWQWPYQPTTITPTVLLISLLLIIIFLLAIQQNRLRLITLILLSSITPLLLILQSRAGIGVLVRRIVHPDLNGHFTAALTHTDPLTLLSDYPQIVQTLYMHAHGHPPGVTLLYQSFLNLVSNPALGLYLILLFTFLTHISISVMIYLTLRSYTNSAYHLTMLWIAIPAVNLFIPLPDLLYTLLPLSAFYLLLHKHYLLSGVLFYISLFFSLSSLPALLLYLLLSKFSNTSQLKYFLLGFLFPLALLALIGFDTLTTLTTILTTQTPRSYHLWLISNIVDFVIYSGLPIWLIIFLKFRQLASGFIFRLLLITLIALSISGFSRAETGRIWMPLIPVLLLSLATSIPPLTTKTISLLTTLLITQTIILNLFWVSLW